MAPKHNTNVVLTRKRKSAKQTREMSHDDKNEYALKDEFVGHIKLSKKLMSQVATTFSEFQRHAAKWQLLVKKNK